MTLRRDDAPQTHTRNRTRGARFAARFVAALLVIWSVYVVLKSAFWADSYWLVGLITSLPSLLLAGVLLRSARRAPRGTE